MAPVQVVKAGGVASLVARPASGGQMAKSLPQEQVCDHQLECGLVKTMMALQLQGLWSSCLCATL